MTDSTDTPKDAPARPCFLSGRPLHAVLFALILLAGLLPRIYGLERESIWWDEFTSVVHLEPPSDWSADPQFVRWNQMVIRNTAPSLLGFWKQNRSMDPATMPLYYTFEYLWSRHVSNDFDTQRWLSIFIGMLLLPAAYLLGRMFFGPGGGLVVMLCVALSPIHIQFSREIRMYGLMTVLAAVSVYSYARIVGGGGRRWWVLHGLNNMVLFWTHPFAVLIPFTEFVFWALAFPRDWRRIGKWIGLHVLAVAPVAVYIASIRFWDQSSTDTWMRVPNLNELAGDLFADDAIGMTYQLNASEAFWNLFLVPEAAGAVAAFRWTVGTWYMAAVLLAVAWFFAKDLLRVRAAACAAGGCDAPPAADKGPAGAPCRWKLFLLLWFLLPPLVLFAASYFWRPCMMPRYTLHCSLALYCILAGGVTALPWRSLRAGAVGLLLCFYGYQLSLMLPEPQHPDWRSAIADIKAEGKTDDFILVHNWLWKRVFAYNLGPVPNLVDYGSGWDVLAEKAAFLTDLNLPSTVAPGERRGVWVTAQTDYYARGPLADLERELKLRGLSFDYREFGGIQHVCLYRVRREPGAVMPPGTADALSGEPAREFGDLSLEFWRAGEYENAVAAARKAQAITPGFARAWSYEGMAQKELGRNEEALAAFQKAVSLDFHDYPWSHVNIAMLLLDMDRYQEALDASLRALQLLPNDAWAHACLGRAYHGLGRVDDAIAALEKAASLDPNDQRLRDLLQTARTGGGTPQ